MKPHTCPVCGGTGKVPWPRSAVYENGFMKWDGSANETSSTCIPCSGTGIIWESAPTADNKEVP